MYLSYNRSYLQNHILTHIFFSLYSIYLLGLVYYVQPDATPSDLRAAAKAALLREKENNLQPCNETTTSLPVCPPSKFRSATGECNNILHRSWGSRGDVFLRLLEANYANGQYFFYWVLRFQIFMVLRLNVFVLK